MKLSTLALLSAATLFAAGAVVAEEKTPPTFKSLDGNGDKSLSAEEFDKAGIKQKFAGLDTNGDGKLSPGEYAVVLGDEDCE